MASFFGIAKPGAKGIDIRTHTVTLKAHAAITKGQVVAVSRTITDLSPEGTVVVFDTTAAPGTGADGVDDIKCGIFVCALENVASGAEGKFALSGIVDAEYDGDSTAVGDALAATAASLALDVAANGEKVIAYALETGDDGDVKKVLFDGLNGFSGNQDA